MRRIAGGAKREAMQVKRTIGIHVLALALAIGLVLPVLAPVAAETGPRPEIRAFWVDAFHDGAKTPAQVDQLINDALTANVNTLIVQVRRRGDSYYNLTFEPRAEDPALAPGFDALQYLIVRAHAAGIEVHAWLNTLVGWYSLSTMPADKEHLWWKHGTNTSGTDNWVSYYLLKDAAGNWTNKVAPSLYLDPGHPDAVDYTTEVYLNVVRNYDVDGIHLDYSRYNGTNYGYNPTSLERFKAEKGYVSDPLPTDAAWGAWRLEQTANLMRKIYLGAIAIKPGIKVSSSVIAWGDGPLKPEDWAGRRNNTEAFQDWDAWLREGIIDVAMPMNYDREWDANQKLWFDQWATWEKDHQYNRQIAVGPALYFNYIEQSLAQIRRAQAPSPQGNYAAGVSLYAYASPHVYPCDDYKDPKSAASKALPRQPHQYLPDTRVWYYPLLSRDGGYIDPVLGTYIPTQAVFPTPAPIPPMPWKSMPTKGFIMGTVADFTGATYQGLEVVITGPETRVVRTDGSGWFGAADLAPGHYKVSISKKAFVGRRHLNVWVRPGLVSEANFTQFWRKGFSGMGRMGLGIDDTACRPDPYASEGRLGD